MSLFCKGKARLTAGTVTPGMVFVEQNLYQGGDGGNFQSFVPLPLPAAELGMPSNMEPGGLGIPGD